MNKENILKLYRYNKTDMRNYISTRGNNLINIIKAIQDEPIAEKYSFRTDIGYPLYRKNINDKIKRHFVNSKYRISPEHAQKFYLYEYGTIHQKKISDFGYIVGYELPFFKNRGSGAIDLIAYDDKENVLNLIELKNCSMGIKDDSKESLIRAILEIETYAKFVKDIIKIEKERNNEILLKSIWNEINRLYKKLNIPFENYFEHVKIRKNLLIPESLYSNSLSNAKEKDILNVMPSDIYVHFIKTKSEDFDTNQRIIDCASKDEIEFEINRY